MKIRLLRVCCLLLILCGLSSVSAFSALAKNEPTIAAPKTFSYHADIAIKLAGSSATGYADGEIDIVNQRLHLIVVAEEDGVKIRQELILIGNRLYIYNEQRQRWEYIDGATQTPEGLPPTTLPALTVPKHPTAAYERIGEETIAGATTNKWRAAGPYNVLLPFFTSRDVGGILIEENITAEALIGAANNYLYRLSVDEAGTITEIAENATPPTTITSKLVYTYSDFDQPVTITAPEGAVPAPRNLVGATSGRDFATPLARAAQLPDATGTARIIDILLPAGLPRP